jgi:hypothetical protein
MVGRAGGWPSGRWTERGWAAEREAARVGMLGRAGMVAKREAGADALDEG